MDTIAVPIMLILAGVSLITAVVGIVGWIMDQSFKNKHAAYWWRIVAGICFLSQAVNGAVAVRYLTEGRTWHVLIVLLILALGMWLFSFGLRLRKRVLGGES